MKAIQDFLKNLISKFNFHSIENMKIFLNFIISARWMLIKIMEYPDKIQILSIIFMKLYPLKMEAGRYCGPPQKMGSSWKHLGEINLERQYQRSIPVSFRRLLRSQTPRQRPCFAFQWNCLIRYSKNNVPVRRWFVWGTKCGSHEIITENRWLRWGYMRIPVFLDSPKWFSCAQSAPPPTGLT